MIRNQFIYTRKEGDKEYKDSFNVNKVIRSMTLNDERVVLVLDDFNERVTQQPDINPKNGKPKGIKNVRETVQSEIILNKEDGERFYKLTNVEL